MWFPAAVRAPPHTYTATEVQTAGITGSDRFTVTSADSTSATLSVDSAWNTIKNVLAESAGAADVTLRNVVNADVSLGDGGDSTVSIDGAKRGDITTGDGNDAITINATSNGGSGNDFNLSTGAGDDSVAIAGATYTIANISAGTGADNVRLTGGFSQVSVAAGDGDDTVDLSAATFDKAAINAGSGDDTIVIGAGRGALDALVGGAGLDTVEVRLSATQYTAAVQQDLIKLKQFMADPANAGKSFTVTSLGVAVTDIEALHVFVDGQPIAVDNPPAVTTVSGGIAAESTTTSPTQAYGLITAVDTDGDRLSYSVQPDNLVHHGTLSVASDGSFVFVAQDSDWSGTDRFTVRVSDGRGGFVDQVVGITVTPTQDAPEVGSSDAAGAEDAIVTGKVAARDADGDRLRYSFGRDEAATPITRIDTAHGTAIIDPNTGAYRFVPSHDWSGSDSFTVQVSDGTSVVQTPVTVVVAPRGVQTNLHFRINDQQTWNPDYATGNFVVSDVSAFGATDVFTAEQMRTEGIVGSESLAVFFTDADSGAVKVNSGWNTIKSVEATSDANANVSFDNVVNTDVRLGEGGDSHVAINGAKRGDISTASGNDTVTIIVQSNDNGWDNTFNISTGAGNDAVAVNGYVWTDVSLDSGSGDDTIRLTGTFDDVLIQSGDGNDVVTVGFGGGTAARADGGAGTDRLVVSLTAAQYTDAVKAEWQTFVKFAADPANQGATFVFTTLNGLKATNFEELDFLVDGQPVSLNHAPKAVADKLATLRDAPRVILATDLLKNDSDADGDALSVVSAGNASHGTVTFDALTGQLLFTPEAGFTGSASFDYTISDGHGGQATATATVKVLTTQGNTGPVAVDDFLLGTCGDDILTGGNDGGTLVGGGGNDTLIGGAGDDTFIVNGGDVVVGGGGNDTVIAVGGAPLVIDMGQAGIETVIGGTGGDTITLSPGGVAFGGDGDDVFIGNSGGGGSSGGSISGGNGFDTVAMPGNAGDYSYTWNGSGGWTFTPVSGGATTVTGVELVDFGDLEVEFDANMRPCRFRVYEDVPVTIPKGLLLANDSDPDGDTLTIVSVQDAERANVALDANGNISFVGVPDYNGLATFTYTISDGHGGFDTATVTVKIWPVNDAPVVNGEAFSIDEDSPLVVAAADLLANDSDVDGDTLTLTSVGNVVGGTVALVNGQVTFTPAPNFNGEASFQYTVSDGHGATSTATATVSVAPINDAPITTADSYVTHPGNAAHIPLADLLANDRDPDGDILTVTGVGTAIGGTIAIVNGEAVFTPTLGFVGTGSFIYTVSDGKGGTATQKVFVDVAGTSLVQSTEQVVNSTTASDQISAAVTVLANGAQVVLWQSKQSDDTYDAYGRVTAPDGTVGPEFRVNSYLPQNQNDCQVTALAGGGFVVVWNSYQQDGSDYGVYGQRYDATGVPAGSEFKINEYTTNTQYHPQVTAMPDGGFVAVWQSNGQDGQGGGIYGRRYDAGGHAMGTEFLVNPTVSWDETDPSVTALANGGFVVTWSICIPNEYNWDVCGRLYDAAGQPLSSTEFVANSIRSGVQTGTRVTALPDGGFVVAWQSAGQDGSGYGVYGQRYNAAGQKLGGGDPHQHLHQRRSEPGGDGSAGRWRLRGRMAIRRTGRRKRRRLRPALQCRRPDGGRRNPGQRRHRRQPIQPQRGGTLRRRLRRHLAKRERRRLRIRHRREGLFFHRRRCRHGLQYVGQRHLGRRRRCRSLYGRTRHRRGYHRQPQSCRRGRHRGVQH